MRKFEKKDFAPPLKKAAGMDHPRLTGALRSLAEALRVPHTGADGEKHAEIVLGSAAAGQVFDVAALFLAERCAVAMKYVSHGGSSFTHGMSIAMRNVGWRLPHGREGFSWSYNGSSSCCSMCSWWPPRS